VTIARVPSGTVFLHGTNSPDGLLKSQTFDWARLGQTDHGFFGVGFYLFRDEPHLKGHARAYGKHILAVRLRPGTTLLRERRIERGSPCPPYHDAMRADYLARAKRKTQAVADEFDALYDPRSPEFDTLGWFKQVTAWVRSSGVADGVDWGEVVLTNPGAIAEITKYKSARKR